MAKILAFILIVFLTNTIQTISGFAGTMLAMPLSIFIYGVDDARIVLNAIGIINCIIVLKECHLKVNYKEVRIIIIWMFFGILAGQVAFCIFPTEGLLKFYGGFIVLISIKNLFWKHEIQLSKWMGILIVFMAGIIHGMFVSGGSLLVIYAMQVLKDKSEFRASLSVVWLIMNGCLFGMQLCQRLIYKENVAMIVACLLPVFLSCRLGNKFHDRIPEKEFRVFANILVFLSGCLLLLK